MQRTALNHVRSKGSEQVRSSFPEGCFMWGAERQKVHNNYICNLVKTRKRSQENRSPPPKLACGNCYQTDAVRCASCSCLGMQRNCSWTDTILLEPAGIWHEADLFLQQFLMLQSPLVWLLASLNSLTFHLKSIHTRDAELTEGGWLWVAVMCTDVI